MKPTIATTTATVVAALLAGGCANTSPEWEKTFGDASRQMRAAQVIDPDAPSRQAGPGVTDGKAAAGAQKAYAESHGYGVKEATPPSLFPSASAR